MTRERAKELQPVFNAFADGKTIQVFSISLNNWRDIPDPNWESDGHYRIKPEPRVFWVNIYQDDCTRNALHMTKEKAECWRQMGGQTIKVQEVL